MRISLIRIFAAALIVHAATITNAHAEIIKVGVVQTVIEDRLEKNRDKILRFIDEAAQQGCRLVVFPEGALYWVDVAAHHPTRAELDEAIAAIGRRARDAKVYVLFGVGYRRGEAEEYPNRGALFDPTGERLIFYWKNAEVPQRFLVDGVPCNFVICSDRGYLEHSDLPCLVQDSKIIIDISGGHGGDDGRPDMRWIRYRPWARRTGAYVIVANPVHDDTDFMGHSPWGGGSAVIRPDGSIQASRTYEKDVIIVEELDTDRAARSQAVLRRNHPALNAFWDAGKSLLESGTIKTAPEVAPFSSERRSIRIAAAQMACSQDIGENTRKILEYIRLAAGQKADIVLFPELVLTGGRINDIREADQSTLESAIAKIQEEAKSEKVFVIVGLPSNVSGSLQNCAYVIGDDGEVKTKYAQIGVAPERPFRGSDTVRGMWFSLKGVQSIVTIGDDADWIELGDLAATRGMCLHFHLRYAADATEEDALLRRETDLLMLSYAAYGAVVNAATPADLPRPSSPAGGGSLIVSREGGHAKPAPDGIEYYLPYQTSIVKSAGADEALIMATRTVPRFNNLDLNRNWRNRNRRGRAQQGWAEWMKVGARMIAGESLD